MNQTKLSLFIGNFRNATIRKVMKAYQQLKVKATLTSLDIMFITKCIGAEVFPKFVVNSLKWYKGNRVLLNRLMKSMLKWELNEKYSMRDNIFKKVMYLQLKLLNSLHRLEFESFDAKVHDIVKREKWTKIARHNSKFENLVTNKQKAERKTTPIQFGPKFINLSDTIFSKNEEELLNKGTKFCPPPPIINKLQDLVIEVNNKADNKSTKYGACQKIDNFYTKNKKTLPSTSRDNKTLKNIREKVKKDDVIVTKADKTNCIVFLGRNNYEKKVEKFFNARKLD